MLLNDFDKNRFLLGWYRLNSDSKKANDTLKKTSTATGPPREKQITLLYKHWGEKNQLILTWSICKQSSTADRSISLINKLNAHGKCGIAAGVCVCVCLCVISAWALCSYTGDFFSTSEQKKKKQKTEEGIEGKSTPSRHIYNVFGPHVLNWGGEKKVLFFSTDRHFFLLYCTCVTAARQQSRALHAGRFRWSGAKSATKPGICVH